MNSTIIMDQQLLQLESLKECISEHDPVTIVVSDELDQADKQSMALTRLGHYLHDEMDLSYGQIYVLIAHRDRKKSTPEEKKRLTGDYIVKKCRITDHDSEAPYISIKGKQGSEISVSPMVVGRKVISFGDTLRTVTSTESMDLEEITKAINPACTIAIA